MIETLIALSLLAAPAATQEQVQAESARQDAARAEQTEVLLQQRAGATETLQVPVTGQAIDSQGRTVTVSGVLSVVIAIPEPVGPQVQRVTDAATGQPAFELSPGQRLVIEGRNLLQPGTTARVHIAGRLAAGTTWANTRIEVTVPPVATLYRGPVQVLWRIDGVWTVVAALDGFTLSPGPPPPPPPPPPDPTIPQVLPIIQPTLYGLKDALGRPLSEVKPGDRVIAPGAFLGLSGRLWWGVVEVEPLAWSDTAVEFTVPGDRINDRGHNVTVRTQEGKHASSMVLNEGER